MKTIAPESFILFNQQLAAMLALDLPLPESLRQVSAQMEDPGLRRAVDAVTREVERGGSYSQAIEKQAADLPELYGAMVKAGEEGGSLAEILRQAAAYQHEMLLFENKVKANLVYPAMLLVGALMLVALFGFLVIPRMALLVESAGFVQARLPLPTRLLLWLAGSRALLVATATAAAGGFLYRVRLAESWEENQFRLPFWGDLALAAFVARIAATLGVLLKNGVPLDQALLLTGNTLDNRLVRAALDQARRAVRGGKMLGPSLAATGLFPTAFTWMVGAAEERGGLEACLMDAGRYYQQRVERLSQVLARSVEPLLLLLLGIAVAALALASFLPMFSMGELIG